MDMEKLVARWELLDDGAAHLKCAADIARKLGCDGQADMLQEFSESFKEALIATGEQISRLEMANNDALVSEYFRSVV